MKNEKILLLVMAITMAVARGAFASSYKLDMNNVSYDLRVMEPGGGSPLIYEQLASLELKAGSVLDNTGAERKTIVVFFENNQVELAPGAVLRIGAPAEKAPKKEGSDTGEPEVEFELLSGEVSFLLSRNFGCRIAVEAGSGDNRAVYKLPASRGRAEDVLFIVRLNGGSPECIAKNGHSYFTEGDSDSCDAPINPDTYGWANPIAEVVPYRADNEYYDEVAPPPTGGRPSFGDEDNRFELVTYPDWKNLSRNVRFYATVARRHPREGDSPNIKCIFVIVPDECSFSLIEKSGEEEIGGPIRELPLPDEEIVNYPIVFMRNNPGDKGVPEDAECYYPKGNSFHIFQAQCAYSQSRMWPIIVVDKTDNNNLLEAVCDRNNQQK